MKQKIHKTPTTQRDAYKYYDAEGRLVITLRPDAATQVTDIHIKFLHSFDDAEVYNNHKNCTSGMVNHETADMELSIGLRRKSQWVLSLNQLTDESDGSYRENTRLLEEAYRNEEERRRDVRKELLYEAVSYLETSQQELFRQYYIEEMTQSEIAKLAGVSVPAIHKRRMKLEKQLKEIIFKKILPDG